MNDEELADMFFNRHDGPSAEANAALAEVLGAKADLTAFERAIDRKQRDFNDEVEAATREVEVRDEASRQSRAKLLAALLLRIAAIGVLLIGVFWGRG